MVVLLAVVVALLAILVISLLRSHAEILRVLNDAGVNLDPSAGAPNDGGSPVDGRTAEGVPQPADALGRTAPDIAGPTPKGDAIVMSMSLGHTPTLVAFLSTGCLTCRGFWEDMAPPDAGTPEGTRTVIVTQGEEVETPSSVAELAPADIPVVMSTDAWEAYGIPVAPYFVLVENGEVVGEGAAASWDQVRDLLERSRRDAAAAAGRKHSRRDLIGGNRNRIDDELREAGIAPGDPSLYHGNGDNPEGTR
ncbi:MAG: TlpA family protein disulfide reductase [Microthrixaceae bacterium]